MQNDALLWAFQFHYHTDRANAAVHCAPVKFSPITFRLYLELAEGWPTDVDIAPEMAVVKSHIGLYEEDRGR
jgi:hypothetical protein